MAQDSMKKLIGDVSKSMIDQFASVFLIDIEKHTIKALKKSTTMSSGVFDEIDLDVALKGLVEQVDEKYRDLWMSISKPNFVNEYFKNHDKREFIYEVSSLDEPFRRCEWYVYERKDGNPVKLFACMGGIDDIRSEKLKTDKILEEKEEKLKHSIAENAMLTDAVLKDAYCCVKANLTKNTYESPVYVDINGQKVDFADQYAKRNYTYEQLVGVYAESHTNKETREKLVDFLSRENLMTLYRQGMTSPDFVQREQSTDRGIYYIKYVCYMITDEISGDVLLEIVGHDISDKIMRDKRQKRQENLVLECTKVLYENIESEKAVEVLLRNATTYYEAEFAYSFEFDHDNEKLRNTAKYDALNDKTGNELKMTFPADVFSVWFDSFRLDGELRLDYVGEVAELVFPESDNLRSLIAVPIISGKDHIGFIIVGNPKSIYTDISMLKLISALVESEILRRRLTEEDHMMLDVVSGKFNSLFYVDLDKDTARVYSSDFKEFDKFVGRTANYTYSVEYFIKRLLGEDEKEKARTFFNPNNILNRLKKEKMIDIDFTLKDGENYRTYEFDIMKATGEGNKCVMFTIDNTPVLKRERQVQEQLETTVLERTSELREKAEQLNEINEEIIELFGNITEARDVESGEHIRRVKGFTHILATQMMKDWKEYGLTEDKVELMTSASALHDIGKIMIPDAILLKPGRLTKEEFEIMKTHSEKGCEVLKHAPKGWSQEYLEMSLDICRHHHEKWDGKGYPDGLKGDEIPLSAQIVSVSDCFDALTTKRPYKDAFTAEQAYEMILRGECGAFSDKIMSSFKKCRKLFVQHVEDTESVFKSQNAGGIASRQLTGIRLILAEDNDMIREITKEIIESEGAEVEEAENGKVAFDLVVSNPAGSYDAVIMDINMPILNGYDSSRAIRSLRGRKGSIPIIALTANKDEEDIQKAIDAGMNTFITKPVSGFALSKALLTCMKQENSEVKDKLDEAVELANKDALTGVGNLTAYTEVIGDLTQKIMSGERPEFAIVFFDINNLKAANDTYGHDVGDIYIKSCAKLIQSVFKKSMVYRTGGDEFAVVLTGEEYKAREKLADQFRKKNREAMKIADYSEGKASLASGMSVFDPDNDKSVSAVTKRADTAMYANKKLIKFASSGTDNEKLS